MIPLRDENPTRSRAWVTGLLILANVLISIWQWTLSRDHTMNLMQSAAFIPARLGDGVGIPGLAAPLTLITSQFLHGGPLHLAGNMLFLWIFGNNVEDEMGHLRFLLFYLLCGIGAAFAHYATQPGSTVPTVGASGAISGVMGAYALLYPGARIHTLVILVFFISVVPIPALIWVGIWLAVQILQGTASRGAATGVAWFAHIGGFLAGMILLALFRRRRTRPRMGPFRGMWADG